MTTSINVTFEFIRPTELVEPNYENQFPRQMPIYLKIDFSETPPKVQALAQEYRITGTPFDEWHGHMQTFQLPNNVDASALAEFVSDDLSKLINSIKNGYESVWDGSNYVACFNDDAQVALDEMRQLIENQHNVPTYDEGGLWDIREWLDASTHRATVDDPTARLADEFTVTAKTTDDEIKGMAAEIVAATAAENVVIDGDVEDYIIELRNECREILEEE